VAFLMSAVFLLLLVPDRSFRSEPTRPVRPSEPAASDEPREAPATKERHPPLSPATTPALPVATALESVIAEPPRPVTAHLPVQREGTTHFIALDDIVAVHANAHYTYVFDGTSKYFCSLPISDVEGRLDRARFVRVHRSHIVNLDRVVGLKRAGDTGIIELAGNDRYTVPVSRSRFGGLRSRLGLGAREAVT